MAGPGLAAVPILGAPSAGPTQPTTSPLLQLGQAVGQYPMDQLKIQQQRADTDAANMQSAAQRINVLNTITSQNQATLGDPNIVSAYERAYKQMGLPAPTISDGGTKRIDPNATGAYHGIQSFIAQNLPMLRQMDPTERGPAIKAATGVDVPQAMLDALNKLPRQYLQSPAEAGQLLSYVKSSVASLGKPGGSIDNVVSAISAVAKPLGEIGIDSNGLVAQLKPDLYAQAMQQAQLNLIQAKTEKQRADAQSELTLLPEKIAQIRTTDDLKKVMETYYPQMAAAATSNAQSTAALVGPKIDALRATTAKDFAEADKAHADMTSLLSTGNLSLKFGVKNPTELLKTLQTSAHEAQGRVDKLTTSYNTALQDAQLFAGQPYGTQAQAAATQYKAEIDKATKDATDAGALYTRMQSQFHIGGDGDQKPGGAPADMKPGTVEYYSSLNASGKQQYLKRSDVPEDVRKYLAGLH